MAHPIVEEYADLSTELDLIIEKHYDRDSFFESTFLEIVKISLFKASFDIAIYQKIDQALIDGHPDENMYLLFINAAISVAWHDKQREKTKSLISIGNTLSMENIHEVIRCLYMQATTLPMFDDGLNSEPIRILKTTVGIIGTGHPRYQVFLHNYASALSATGRLSDLNEAESQAFNSPPEHKSLGMLAIKLTNCAYIGDYELGFQLIQKFKSKIESSRYNFLEKLSILKIRSGDFNPDHYQNEFKSLAVVLQSLSKGCVEEAIKSYKAPTQPSDLSVMHPSNTGYYIPIHLALCLGKSSDARALLKNTDIHHNPYNYLDDFFLIRVLLLERNYVDARFVLQRLIANVEHYGALGRILFELQFAKELNPSHFLLLMHDWTKFENLKKFNARKPVLKLEPLKGLALLIGHGQKIQQIRSQIQQYAVLQETVLILGETGTGKELVAKALHQESDSNQEPFLAINCGALTDNLLESELFGYEAGSFTGALKQKKGIFESAGKGTVFLDEFGDINPKLQVSLLRVLESAEIRMIGGSENRKISCRIVVAANNNLEQAVKDRSFREDLYYRLNRLEIYLPPLRERKEDISDLVTYFLSDREYSSDRQRSVTADFLNAFNNYNWPGNIRELKNAMDRLKILNPNKDIFDIDDLAFIKFQGDFSRLCQSDEIIEKQQNSTPPPTQTEPMVNFSSVNNDRIQGIISRPNKVDQRLEYLQRLFQEHKKLTRAQIIEILQISPSTATRNLDFLLQSGFIKKVTPTKSARSHYFLLNE